MDASAKSDWKPSVEQLADTVLTNLGTVCSSLFREKIQNPDEKKQVFSIWKAVLRQTFIFVRKAGMRYKSKQIGSFGPNTPYGMAYPVPKLEVLTKIYHIIKKLMNDLNLHLDKELEITDYSSERSNTMIAEVVMNMILMMQAKLKIHDSVDYYRRFSVHSDVLNLNII